jgi:hypothetical protein
MSVRTYGRIDAEAGHAMHACVIHTQTMRAAAHIRIGTLSRLN